MIRLVLVGLSEEVSLNELIDSTEGVQAIAGATGFGLPRASNTWQASTSGDQLVSSTLQGRIVDLPLYVEQASRANLTSKVAQLSRILQGPCQLQFHDSATPLYHWNLDVVREGGGEWTLGEDTNSTRFLETVLTLRSESPYWTRSTAVVRSGLSAGNFSLTPIEDAPVSPIVEFFGPALDPTIILPDGSGAIFDGCLGLNETLTVDLGKRTAVDSRGRDWYTRTLDGIPGLIAPPGTPTTIGLQHFPANTVAGGYTDQVINLVPSPGIPGTWTAPAQAYTFVQNADGKQISLTRSGGAAGDSGQANANLSLVGGVTYHFGIRVAGGSNIGRVLTEPYVVIGGMGFSAKWNKVTRTLDGWSKVGEILFTYTPPTSGTYVLHLNAGQMAWRGGGLAETHITYFTNFIGLAEPLERLDDPVGNTTFFFWDGDTPSFSQRTFAWLSGGRSRFSRSSTSATTTCRISYHPRKATVI